MTDSCTFPNKRLCVLTILSLLLKFPKMRAFCLQRLHFGRKGEEDFPTISRQPEIQGGSCPSPSSSAPSARTPLVTMATGCHGSVCLALMPIDPMLDRAGYVRRCYWWRLFCSIFPGWGRRAVCLHRAITSMHSTSLHKRQSINTNIDVCLLKTLLDYCYYLTVTTTVVTKWLTRSL